MHISFYRENVEYAAVCKIIASSLVGVSIAFMSYIIPDNPDSSGFSRKYALKQ